MTYEYVCGACGHQWEAEQSIKDRPLEECVSCGAKKAKRLISGGTGFLLKGGGWYADLYGSPGSGSAKAADDKGGKAGATAAKSEGSDAKSSGDSKSSGDGKAAASTGTSSGSSSSASSSSGSSSSGSSSSASTPSAKAS
jgi:putative FmdB family regulatory protein